MPDAQASYQGQLLRDWYSAPSHEQDRIWNGQTQKCLQIALVQTSLGQGYGAAGDLGRTWEWLDHLAFLSAIENFPGAWVANVLASGTQGDSPLGFDTEREPGSWLAVEPSVPIPIDMEADALAQRIENQDTEALLPLLVSMGEDQQARQVVLDRVALRMAEDSYGDGVRSILFQQWRRTAAALPSPLFAAVTITCLRLHWHLPNGACVAVPEGRAECPVGGNNSKPLLQSLRERDLGSYMGHIRAMGDQPVGALRQLFIAVALMVLEYPEGPGLEGLGRLYLWLGSVLAIAHRSLRRSRRILFSAAASVFRHGGWQAQKEWPAYASLVTFHHALQQGESPEIRTDWQKTLWAHSGNGDADAWWMARAEQYGMHTATAGAHASFWALWQQARVAGSQTGGPLSWIHPLVLQRLFPV